MFLTIVKCQTIAIVLGYILDLIIGDPHWLYHPVQLIGGLITFFEKLLLKKDDKDETKYIKGAVLAVLVLFVTGAVVILFLAVFYNISIAAGCIAETIMCYQILAVKSLRVESMKVYTALKQEGIEQARIAVSMIVGRDTMQLDNHGVIRAAVETVAENTSDGVVAPLFYMFSLSLFHMDPLIENTLILIMCMPVASNSSVYAFMYGEDATLASKAIFLTSVSCVVTIPIVFILHSL